MTSRRRFSRSKSGSALIEFAMLAPVFFLTIGGLVEYVLFQYKSYALNHIVYEAARNLQTGEIQGAADKQVAFSDEVCAQAAGVIDCNKIDYDVRSFSSIGAITFPAVTFDEDGKPVGWVFQPGGANQYSVVRAALPHQFITPFMDQLFHVSDGLPAIITTYIIVKNEPW